MSTALSCHLQPIVLQSELVEQAVAVEVVEVVVPVEQAVLLVLLVAAEVQVQVVLLVTLEQLQFLGLIRVYKHGDKNEYCKN
jgi:hypothetical protein